jgi:hypothetical protein
MGAIRPVRPVNLICGLISNDPDLMQRSIRLMCEHLGETDDTSELYPFDMTDYYTVEMGEDLRRQFVSFADLVDPASIVSVKRLTNEIESRICYDLGLDPHFRRVNLDPGYLTLSKLVLATTKDFSHRVYLGNGIYAESTLQRTGGKWQGWPWTYPDYASDRYHSFFEACRERFRKKLLAREADEGGTP